MNHGIPPDDWDLTLQHRQGSFLQSRAWAAFQEALGRGVVYSEGQGYQWLAGIRRSHGLSYLMCSYGPAADSPGAMRAANESVVRAARELNLDFVRIEPQKQASAEMLSKIGAHQIAEADPTHNHVIDLTDTEEVLRGALDSGHRNRVNGTERRGISIHHSHAQQDFSVFLEMLHDTANRSGVQFYPDSYFRAMFATFRAHGVATLYLAKAEGKPVAAALFYDWGKTRYYAHAGAFQEQNRKLKASVSLVWQAILDAKQAGLESFDLWGVAPEGDENHHLASLSHFKRGFGGQAVAYAGTWDIPVKPAKYRLYRVYRRLKGRQ